MLENLLDGSTVNILIAFIAGITTFFASCLVPLVPLYLAYLSGLSLNTNDEIENNKSTIVKAALFFVAGFILTFIVLSVTLTQFTIWLNPLENLITFVAGTIFILLGLFVLGVFKSPLLGAEHKFKTDKIFAKYKNIHALITGIAFGFGWSPCIGPVLAVILYLTAKEMMIAKGMVMLLAYGIGLGVPFIIIAAGFEKIMPRLKKLEKFSYYLNILSGVVIIITGILILTGKLDYISAYILRALNLHLGAL